MTLVDLLQAVRIELARINTELERERPDLLRPWPELLAQFDLRVERGAKLEELGAWAQSVSNVIGVGMGSLTDIYVSDELDRALKQVSRLAWELKERWRNAPENPNILRRHLVALEEELLAHGMQAEAARIRELVRDELDVDKTVRVVESLAGRTDLTDPMHDALGGCRESLWAIRRKRAGEPQP